MECSETIKTEAVFAKIKMNNGRKIIFLKKQGVFTKYPDWSCIYQARNEQWKKH